MSRVELLRSGRNAGKGYKTRHKKGCKATGIEELLFRPNDYKRPTHQTTEKIDTRLPIPTLQGKATRLIIRKKGKESKQGEERRIQGQLKSKESWHGQEGSKIKQAWMEQKNHHGTDMGLPTAITATDSRMEVSTFG